jgi:UDP-glucose 4-epimerase
LQTLTHQKILYFQADLNKIEEIHHVFDQVYEKTGVPIYGVIHFAALKAVGESVKMPLQYFQTNVGGTINLLLSMQLHKCNKFIFSSSACVYGDSGHCTETDQTIPKNPYGHTKIMVEDILKHYCASNPNFRCISLRYFNPIGAHPSGQIGESPNDIPNNLVPIILRVAMGKQASIKVFGSDYPTEDGTGLRDYIHVMDVSEAHVSALVKLEDSMSYDCMNLATGAGSTVLQVINAFVDATGVKIPYVITERRPGDVAKLVAVPDKANLLLKWKAKRTVKEACKDVYNWISKNPNGYKN